MLVNCSTVSDYGSQDKLIARVFTGFRQSPTSVSEVFRKKRGISHVCDANGVPFLSAGSLMCVTRTVLLTPSASVSI